MSLPDEWVAACHISENRMRDETPIDNIRLSFCLAHECPAAKMEVRETPFGEVVMVNCMFSKCFRRYPSKKELKCFK